MKKQDDDGDTGRQPYEKPQLRSFPLAAGEVLAKGCKMNTPSTAWQGTGCVSGGCVTLGS